MTDRREGQGPVPRPTAEFVDAALRAALAPVLSQAANPAEIDLTDRLAAALRRRYLPPNGADPEADA